MVVKVQKTVAVAKKNKRGAFGVSSTFATMKKVHSNPRSSASQTSENPGQPLGQVTVRSYCIKYFQLNLSLHDSSKKPLLIVASTSQAPAKNATK